MATNARSPDGIVRLDQLEPSPRWSLAQRIAFRWWLLYVSGYVLLTQLLGTIASVPGIELPDPGTLPPFRPAIEWVAKRVFGVAASLVVTGSGSGDKVFDWTEAACLVAFAAVGAAIWSFLDRARPGYARLDTWLRFLVRLAVGSSFISYGIDKVIPLQMPAPFLTRLVEPYGDLSPMGVLWTFIGTSRPYEVLIGCAETLAGILILIPRTALLGALLSFLSSLQIFVLNMAYDVPVKLFSFHLVLFTAYLLAPEAGRLWGFFVANRGAAPSPRRSVFRGPKARRAAVAAGTVYVLYLIAGNVSVVAKGWNEFGGGAPRSPLFGVWEVESMTTDGVRSSGLATDGHGLRRVLLEFPTSAAFQRMDNSFERYKASVTPADRKLALSKPDDQKWKASFSYDRPRTDRLVLDGEMDDRRIHLELRLVDHTKFLLLSRGFHWVQEYPFNR